SGSRQKLYWPPVCTPTVNCRLIEEPAVSGVARPMAGTLNVELKPPPAACVGGVSTVVPEMFAVPPPLSETLVFDEVSARRAALFTAGGFVVMSTMRKRSCARWAPVLFVKVRRKLSVPVAPLVTGVMSRKRFGASPRPLPVSTSAAGSVVGPVRVVGLERFDGPAAPSFGELPRVSPTTVLTKRKSFSFAPVSFGVPVARSREKVICPVGVAAGTAGRDVTV